MFEGRIETAGEVVDVHCAEGRIGDLLSRAVGQSIARLDADRREPTITIDVQAGTAPFDLRGLRTITRGAASNGTRSVLHNACGSGFDLQVETSPQLTFTARYRPTKSLLSANMLLRSRFALLAGQTLVHYPALWRAGWRDRVPLHVAVLRSADATPMLAGPGGVGKSTVVAAALGDGASVTADNVCAADGADCFGLAEPLRIVTSGRAVTSQGRSENPIPRRVGSLAPDRIVLLERGPDSRFETACPRDVARAIVAGTYSAGELRRYWQFAATLALATDIGPAHPPIREVAAVYADRLPGVRVQVGDGDRLSLTSLCGATA